MELGIYSFVERTPEPETGRVISGEERLQRLMEEIQLADEVGLDVFGIGEHHREEYVASSPAVILAAAAVQTKRIRLTSAVSVLSSDDPVRVFQDFATVDLLSGGRAEVMAGRGSFIESFPLFGYDLADYDDLFAEKLALLLRLTESERVTWSGQFRPDFNDLGIYPRPVQNPLPVWLAIGGTPASAVRAGELGLPLAIAIIGGMPERFHVFAQLHRRAAETAGHGYLPLSLNCHGYIAPTTEEAANDAFIPFKTTMDQLGQERGWPPMSRAQFDASLTLKGAHFIGSPEDVVEKIMYQYDIFQFDRFLLQFSVGTFPHDKVMRSIRLFGEEVAPAVREQVQRRRQR